ncbi:MAG TPA: outer membrane beta-barrel domain-containing protein [Polyangiaceae bacterium]|jgi:outer membrane beta-barrel protein|nr:outer membrane beta-barrel domain-containing protein [Polyangiaceae bacterium]
MKKVRIALLVAAALCLHPLGAQAAGKGKGKKAAAAPSADEKAADNTGDKAAPEAPPPAPAEGDASGEAAGAAEGDAAGGEEGAAAEGEGEADEGEAPSEAEKAGDLEGICKVDPEACPKLDFDKEAARDIKEQVYAVEQVFALRVRRFELQPYWSLTLNDQFVSHPGPGVGLNYWITQVLAIGVNGTYYQPFNADSSFNFETRRAARVAVPLTEYQWGAAFNFTYVPIAGKFSGFADFIFQYDAYVVGGVGALSTRPIPTIDSDNRSFSFDPKLAFNAGIGLRIFFNRWFAADLEVRDYIFADKIESTTVSATAPTNPDTWYDKSSRLTNNVQAQVGVSVFIPFSFDYRLPK